MKIVINCEWDREYSLGKIYAKYLAELGHDVYCFYDIPELQKLSTIFKQPYVLRINYWRLQLKHSWGLIQEIPIFLMNPVLKRYETELNKKFISFCKSIMPDVVLVFKGKAFYPETLATIRTVTGCRLLYYNADDHFNLYSSSSNMIQALPQYDYVFIWSRQLIDKLEHEGAKNVKYLPFGYDPDIHFPAEISAEDVKKYGHDVVFVGTWDKEREKALSVLSDLDLWIWGPRWNRVSRKSPLYRCIKGEEVDAKTMAKIYGASKVCLNLMRPQNQGSHNMKSFEIPAMGGFMIANRSREHLELFKEDSEIACYENSEELRTLVIKYIRDNRKRIAMAKKAHIKVREKHSYLERAKLLISHLAE